MTEFVPLNCYCSNFSVGDPKTSRRYSGVDNYANWPTVTDMHAVAHRLAATVCICIIPQTPFRTTETVR